MASPPPAAGPLEDEEVALPEPFPEPQGPELETRQSPGHSDASPSLSERHLSEEDLLHSQQVKQKKAKTHQSH